MSESRHLVLKRHPTLKGYLVICDEETGQPLAGQRAVQMNSDALNGPATITVTFEAYGAHGVRLLTDEPRPTQTKQMQRKVLQMSEKQINMSDAQYILSTK